MISKTSFKKGVVFYSALNRFKWFSILYGVALFLSLPLLIWMELSKHKSQVEESLWTEIVNQSYLPQFFQNPIEHFLNVAVPIIFGMILFYYLHKQSASTFFHSLPIKRLSLYLQNLSAGLTLVWLPIIINGLLMYLIFAGFGLTEGQWHSPNFVAYNPGPEMITPAPNLVPIWQVLGRWLVLNMFMTGLFFVFTVFVGMLTGNVLVQGALTLIGLVLPLGLYVLVKINFEMLLYGFPRFNDNNIEWLSPLANYLGDINYRYLFESWSWYGWYLAAAIVICGAGMYLYRMRPSEAAGENLANEWIRGLFKYGVTACTALTGGLYLSSFNENSTGVLYLGYSIGAVLGYVIADMISYKSFRFYRRWKGMLVFGAVFILIICSVKLDVYGYESYIPESDKIQAVFLSRIINEQGQGLQGADNIGRVRLFHQEIIKREKENKALEENYGKMPASTVADVESAVGNPVLMMRMDIVYVLKTGKKVSRSYSIDVNRYREYFYPIFNSEEAKRQMYWQLFEMKGAEIDQINVVNHNFNKNIRIYKRDEIEFALEALRKDALNVSYEASIEGKVPAPAYIEFQPSSDIPNRHLNSISYYPEFKYFEAFLKEKGYLQDLFLQPDDIPR